MDAKEMFILERLINLATGPFKAARQDLDKITAAIEELDGKTCTGAIWWRDPKSETPKMYINHKKDQACPLHGTPKPNGRIRVYIGSDPDKQEWAQEDLAKEARLDALRTSKRRLDSALNRANYRLTEYYHALGYTTPNVWTDPQGYPEPNERTPWAIT